MRRSFSALLFALFLAQGLMAQDTFSPFFVVIGAFEHEANAQKLCARAHEENLPALYALNEERKLFYVFVRATQTSEIADEILARLKKTSVFKDAWVFQGRLSGANLTPQRTSPVVKQQSAPPPIERPLIQEPASKKEEIIRPSPAPAAASTASQPAAAPAGKPVGKAFFFRLLNSENGNPVRGLVRLQESKKSAQYRGYNSEEVVYVPAPANRAGKWVVVCQVMGFRQFKTAVDYREAAAQDGASVGPAQEVILPFELERVRKGDYMDMEAVKFFNNAALFAPGSERELDELVALLEENQAYQIRVHGHTNGKQSRDIVSMGESTDFFNPAENNAKSHASAKELSLLRAELVKSYLVGKGIDAARVSVRGEGGTQMIFDPGGTLAGLNDRVEVEIVKH